MSLIITLYRNKGLKSINKKLLGLYLLNVSDILFSLFLINTGMCYEFNSLMNYVISRNQVFSVFIKVVIPLILLMFIGFRIKVASEPQLYKANIIITTILLAYTLINLSHILWTILYFLI
ncbi:DUF5658 family protein [Clostridium tunisiense]|uniref:DUF5658 family protein n=1 Tax=Clostridium tunisiense TaxID=219748 RepID=UPI00035E234A